MWLGPEVKNNWTKTRWRCSSNHIWEASYDAVQRGSNCSYCTGAARKVSQDYSDLANERGFNWLGPYVEYVSVPCNWRCSKWHEWEARYNDIQQGKGCPQCANHISRPEIQLREAVQAHHPDTQGNIRKLLKSKRFELDIYIPSLKKAVEYDGWAHIHYPEAAFRDARKDRECVEAGIQLLRIPHKEYKANPTATTQRVLEWLRVA